MKNRLLSLICVVALAVTMISASLITGSAAGNTFTHFDGMNTTDWTAETEADMALIKDNGTIDFTGAASANEHWFTNKNTFNSDEYFEFTGKITNTAADGFAAISVGDLTIMFALDKNSDGAVDITNDAKAYLIVKMGDNIIYTLADANWENVTNQWIIQKIDHFTFVYDNGKLTANYFRSDNGNIGNIVTNLDLTARDGWDSDYTTKNQTVKIGAYCWHQSNATFSQLSLVGKTVVENDDNQGTEGDDNQGTEGDDNQGTEGDDNQDTETGKSALVGTGFEFGEDKAVVDTDWTGNDKTTLSINENGALVLKGPYNTENVMEATYKDTFNLAEGFKFTYKALGGETENWKTDRIYLAANVGNITAGTVIGNYNGGTANAVYLVIKIDDAVVATTEEPIFCEDSINWNSEKTASLNLKYFFNASWISYSDCKSNPDYVLTYNAETKTITFTKIALDEVIGTVSFVDTNGTAKLDDAAVSFKGNFSWNNTHTYGAAKLTGKSDAGEEAVKGEALTETWAPETFSTEEWTGSSAALIDGEFVVPEGNGTYTIHTVKSYDLSAGFKFVGTLAMKNGYNNYYNEWCSAIFGNDESNFELRIRNDDTTPSDADKDNTYTAYIYCNGSELASYDLVTAPNGEYEVVYADGKVTVALGGSVIEWTLADGSVATSVGVDADLSNAKLGLRLMGNYARLVRKWSGVSLSPLGSNGSGIGGGVDTGDARNIVFPAVVMLVSAFAAAALLINKKVRA